MRHQPPPFFFCFPFLFTFLLLLCYTVGYDLVTALRKHLESLPAEQFELRTNTVVKGLVVDETTQAISGIEYQAAEADTVERQAVRTVILTCGGYGYNPNSVLSLHAPQLAFLPVRHGSKSKEKKKTKNQMKKNKEKANGDKEEEEGAGRKE